MKKSNRQCCHFDPILPALLTFGLASGAACSIASTTTVVQPASAAKLTNAAQPRYGARVDVATTKEGSRDPATSPDAAFDNDVHSRCVLRGSPPYTFTIELAASLPLERIAFAHSDYLTERAPKDIEISLDGSPAIRHTLALQRPERRKAAWQEVSLNGKTARVVKITILSNHEPSTTVNWGGLAEIAVLTSADLDARFAVPGGTSASAATFVHQPPLTATGITVPKVNLPPVAPPDEHPRLLLTRREVADLKSALASSERGKSALKGLLDTANGAVTAPLDFPDPKGPLGQLNDRGDDVAKRHDRLSLAAGTLGMAYTLTGDPRYATRAAEILRGYAERYESYPEHKGVNKNDTGKVMGQRLSEAMWLIPLIQSYDYIYDSPALTSADKQRIETELIRRAVAFIRRKGTAQEEATERDSRDPGWRTAPPKKGSAANWLLFYNAATMMAGAVLNDGDMKDLAAADFRHLLFNGIGSDGMWEEGAIGYQFFAMSALTGGLETAARQGIDLWSFDNGRMKRLYDSPLRYAYPDGSAPGINDSTRSRFGDWSTMTYDYAYLRYGDPAYAFLVNASPRQLFTSQAVYFPTRVYNAVPEPKAISFPSTVFESLGYGILRAPRTYALMDYGPHGGTHGHFDKLNLILFATNASGKGDEIGGEPKFHRYEDALHGEWTKETVAHNTLTVNESNQIASEGKLVLFEDTAPFKVMRAESTTSAPGARLDRTVVVTPDAVIDLFRGHSASSRTWDRTLRFQGTLAGFPAATATAKPLGTRDGYQHLKVFERRPATDASWTGTWSTTIGPFAATVAGASGQEVILARGPDDDHIALARQTGERADFAVAYRVGDGSGSVKSFRAMPTGDPGTVAVEMTMTDGSTTTVIVAHQPGVWKALGWESDARVLCLQQKGTEKTLLITGGSYAVGKEIGTVRRPSAGNYLIRQIGAGKTEMLSGWSPKTIRTVHLHR
ncbi:MAG: alginate lyase family protein [Armatimonadota bacterium]